ncbi:hypothetical protein [Ectothiorhodospira shaposhnikovii]|uniref:hypothetical protein n=1 Tax=Ectothiorhodospira shaposhnikovii TaxID=1054 RepID=UPI0039A2E458
MHGFSLPLDSRFCGNDGQDADRPTDHDSPWKEALEHYFQEFTQLLFPAIHGEVDWSRGYNPMDKELQQITADANTGRRHADKLIQVYAQDGSETWVLIHVEVQGEPAGADRVFVQDHRLDDPAPQRAGTGVCAGGLCPTGGEEDALREHD